MSANEKYFTVVFRVTDQQAFREEAGRFTQAMFDQEGISGADVTAVGWEDSMTERDNLAEWLAAHGYDADEIARG